MNKTLKEIIYWLCLFILMFLYEAFSHENAYINWGTIFFTLQYLSASLFISYILVPKLLYKKKIMAFVSGIIGCILLVFITEELLLENIFYPKSMRAIYISAWSLLDIIPPITIFTGFKFAWDALDKQNKIEKISRIATENQLQFLNSQINPHFLFNNLNNLYALALEQSPQTPKIILQLSDILRYMLYDCKKDTVALHKDIAKLHQFVELYKMQIGQDADIRFETKKIDTHWHIAPLILIVFVENAFKHAQASQTDNIKISISACTRDNILHFTCYNNYSAHSNTQDLAHGIGLKNVRSKLNLLYHRAHQLSITDKGGWYKVDLKIMMR